MPVRAAIVSTIIVSAFVAIIFGGNYASTSPAYAASATSPCGPSGSYSDLGVPAVGKYNIKWDVVNWLAPYVYNGRSVVGPFTWRVRGNLNNGQMSCFEETWKIASLIRRFSGGGIVPPGTRVFTLDPATNTLTTPDTWTGLPLLRPYWLDPITAGSGPSVASGLYGYTFCYFSQFGCCVTGYQTIENFFPISLIVTGRF